MELLGTYINGNVKTTIFDDGTKIRVTKDNEFNPSFAENMDIKICNRCNMQCAWCHEGSTPDGKLANIMHEKFIDTLHPYQEVALGGGNVLEHPDLVPFLHKLKEKKVITNITLNQYHFESNYDFVKNLIESKLIYGLGISLIHPTTDFIQHVQSIPNAVIHVINGILDPLDMSVLMNNHLKLLILGYKSLRRGSDHLKEDTKHIYGNMNWLKESLKDFLPGFDVISFDNLAIEQLNVKENWPYLCNKKWNEFYAGDDGTNTYYIDMVDRKFARSSTAAFDERYDLLDDVDSMFDVIRNREVM